MTLYPVIMPVDDTSIGLSGKKKVKRLSAIARQALKLSAASSGIRLGELQKDNVDRPIPVGGIYWSLSHKSKYVAAVVDTHKIGIDIEEIKPRTARFFRKTATDKEWSLTDEKNWVNFYRYWTAKEAVLKAEGDGIGGLLKSQVVSVPDNKNIEIDYNGHYYKIEHFYFQNHVVSVVKNDCSVKWIVATSAI